MRVASLRVALVVQAVACLAFLATHGLASLLLASVLYGFGYAAVSTLFPPLVTDFFGRAHAGSIVAALFAIAGSMGGLGPWLAGVLYDATGGYGSTWALGGALNALSFGFMLLARSPARRDPPA